MADEEIRVGNFQWVHETSDVLTGDRNPPKPYVSGFRSMDAHCSCGAKWRARRGSELEPGNFVTNISRFTIKCPRCGREDTLSNPQMP